MARNPIPAPIAPDKGFSDISLHSSENTVKIIAAAANDISDGIINTTLVDTKYPIYPAIGSTAPLKTPSKSDFLRD